MKIIEEKKVGAKARQDYYNSLTVQQRIDKLDRMFGKGEGAKRERARLAKLLAIPETPKKEKRK